MSHKPPLPDAATSPYPAHPAPIEHDAAGRHDKSAIDASDDAPGTRISARNIGIAAGAAIGSAAVAAALLYYNRPSPAAKRTPAKTGVKRAAKPKAATTRKPRGTAAKPTVQAAAAKAATGKTAAARTATGKTRAKTAAAKPAAKPRARAKDKPATTE